MTSKNMDMFFFIKMQKVRYGSHDINAYDPITSLKYKN